MLSGTKKLVSVHYPTAALSNAGLDMVRPRGAQHVIKMLAGLFNIHDRNRDFLHRQIHDEYLFAGCHFEKSGGGNRLEFV